MHRFRWILTLTAILLTTGSVAGSPLTTDSPGTISTLDFVTSDTVLGVDGAADVDVYAVLGTVPPGAPHFQAYAGFCINTCGVELAACYTKCGVTNLPFTDDWHDCIDTCKEERDWCIYEQCGIGEDP